MKKIKILKNASNYNRLLNALNIFCSWLYLKTINHNHEYLNVSIFFLMNSIVRLDYVVIWFDSKVLVWIHRVFVSASKCQISQKGKRFGCLSTVHRACTYAARNRQTPLWMCNTCKVETSRSLFPNLFLLDTNGV